MSKEPVSGLKPLNDCLLVELKQSFKNVHAKEGKHETRTEGLVVAIPKQSQLFNYSMDYIKQLENKRVFFEEFKEGARIKRDGKIYSFIKIEDIRGFENV